MLFSIKQYRNRNLVVKTTTTTTTLVAG